MAIAMHTGWRHADFLLEGVSDDQWDEMLAWWLMEPRGERRADLRSGLQTNILFIPHMKPAHRRMNLEPFTLSYEDTAKIDVFEKTSAEFMAATADMDFFETIAYLKQEYAPAGAPDGTDSPA